MNLKNVALSVAFLSAAGFSLGTFGMGLYWLASDLNDPRYGIVYKAVKHDVADTPILAMLPVEAYSFSSADSCSSWSHGFDGYRTCTRRAGVPAGLAQGKPIQEWSEPTFPGPAVP